jgi:SAM-dependent methyltransferase
MTQRPLNVNWYDHPRYYDIAFQSETQQEADFIEAAAKKYCDFRVRKLLEPACGTGRLVVEMAARGFRVAGLDLSRPMLDYLQRRLDRRKLSAKIIEADMAEFHTTAKYDAAFCTVNSFRHLLTETAARRHLECVADALRPGGIYILGLHMLPLDAAENDCERWTERQGRTQVSVTLRVVETDRRRRIERLRVSLLARDGGKTLRMRDEFPFRMYTTPQFRRLLKSVPAFQLRDTYDFWYDIDEPQPFNDDSADMVFILQKIKP